MNARFSIDSPDLPMNLPAPTLAIYEDVEADASVLLGSYPHPEQEAHIAAIAVKDRRIEALQAHRFSAEAKVEREQLVAERQADWDRHVRRLAKAQAAQEQGAGPNRTFMRVKTFVADAANNGRLLVPVSVEAPSPKKGESQHHQYRRLRDVCAGYYRDHDRVAFSRLPRDETKAGVRAKFEEAAEIGRLDFSRAASRDVDMRPGQFAALGVPNFAPQGLRAVNAGGSLPIIGVLPDSFAMMCWIAKDVLIERAMEEIDRLYADGDLGLSEPARRERMAQILVELEAAERDAEAVLKQAREDGVRVERDENVHPAIILQVELGDRELLVNPTKYIASSVVNRTR